MPRVESDVPEKLRPYLSHGVELSWDDRRGIGRCPWCGRDGKFEVTLDEGLWICRVCAEGTERGGGNAYTFLRKLWEASDRGTTDYSDLAEDRGLSPDTLVHWELVRSSLTGEWLVPGYNVKGKMCQLYRRVVGAERSLLLPTPGMGHHLHGVTLLRDSPTVYVCEGPWDAMALWEALGQCKRQEDGSLVATASAERSLLSEAGVLAVPGCSTFFESWLPLFEGRNVVLMYDNDHPRIANGKTSDPAGWVGMRRAAGILAGTASSVQILRWGGDESHDLNLPSGFDVRDALTTGGEGVVRRLSCLLSLIGPTPDEWLRGRKRHAVKKIDDPTHGCLPCNDYRTVITAWRKALRWTDGLDRALSCMLATITSTQMVGDQLWFKVVGPAACGKSTLCEAISVCHKYVLAKSTIRGFYSGFKEEGGSKAGEDNSLLALLPGKTLVTKDGDTLLQSPNLPQILSEGRDVYDGVSRTHYRNGMGKDYDGLRITWILCGTSSLRQIDSSELGERFLDCVIMDGIDDDLEDEILDRVVNRAARDVAVESDGEISKHYAPEMSLAMQLTGGYVVWLREHAVSGLATVTFSPQVRRALTRLGKFVAHIRARPSLRQEEIAEREFATRLVSQLTRLAGCLALVLNRPCVDEEVMRRVRQVAMDTSRGRTFSIASHLYDEPEGMTASSLAMLAGQTEDKTRVLLKFLRAIEVAEFYQTVSERGVKGKVHWRLTPRMHQLYAEVIGGGIIS
jgi:hypothetical protein